MAQKMMLSMLGTYRGWPVEVHMRIQDSAQIDLFSYVITKIQNRIDELETKFKEALNRLDDIEK